MIVGSPNGVGYFQSFLHGSPYTASLLLLLALGLALCFGGRVLIKGLAFVITGIILASIGAGIGGAFFGMLGLLFGAVVGFIIGGFLGMAVVNLGIGIALGYMAYSTSIVLISSQIISVIVGVVIFFVGIALASQFLSVLTAVVGGLLMFEVINALGFGFLLSAGVAVAMSALGATFQLIAESHAKTRTAKTLQTV